MTLLHGQANWRLLGPFRGGRVVAVAGHPTERLRFYFGSTGGGVWRTDDAGISWRNVSDGFFRRSSVGALAIAASQPSTIYAGMGEACLRNTVSDGDGVWRSDDGGATWRHLGLADTHHIGRVRVDPLDPERVYVAALGHAFGPNSERGVFRSQDGGATWQHVLRVDADTGSVDLCLDPFAPRTLWASTYRIRRGPWRLDSGGPGSGLWRSRDRGESWEDLSSAPGMPAGPLGRIGVTASAAREGRLWVSAEAEKGGGILRSDDGGDHWTALTTRDELRERPFYYSHVIADPGDAETVWALAVFAYRSLDGGATFEPFPVQHGDCHDLWIDPQDSHRMILGDDGGASVTLDGGRSFSTLFNQPTAEIYRVAVDSRRPYHVLATQQDNMTVRLPSHSRLGAVHYLEAREVGGGESGGVAARDDDPDIVFAGNVRGHITRIDLRTDEQRTISVWPGPDGPADGLRHRFNWTAPLFLSPHDPGVLWHAGERVFRSDDEGHTWEAVSGDLSRVTPDRLGSSGGITPDNTGAEHCGTVVALTESPRARGLLWAGTDDGRLHVTTDGGGAWREVSPPGLPEHAVLACVEASPHAEATVWVAVDLHRGDEISPQLWRTDDLGTTWARIDAGLPSDTVCRVVREDPAVPGLLLVGHERGVHASPDGGRTWRRLGGDLPVVPVHDLCFVDDDVVAGTHGRALWILEDLPLLRAWATHRDEPEPEVRLHPARALVRLPELRHEHQEAEHHGRRVMGFWVLPYRRDCGPDGTEQRRWADAGENPPLAAVLTYEVAAGSAVQLERLRITDEDGADTRVIAGETLPGDPGLHRLQWDGRGAPASVPDGEGSHEIEAPPCPPGSYTAILEWRDATGQPGSATTPVEVRADPRSAATPTDHRTQYALLATLHTARVDLARAVARLRRVTAADTAVIAPDAPERAEATRLLELLATPPGPFTSHAAVDRRLDHLAGSVAGSLPPTRAQQALATELLGALGDALAACNRLADSLSRLPHPPLEPSP